MTMELRITELDMDSREPNYFIVTDTGSDQIDPPVFESEDLMACVKYCYDLGVNFEVYTLAAWQRETTDTPTFEELLKSAEHKACDCPWCESETTND